MYIHFERKYL